MEYNKRKGIAEKINIHFFVVAIAIALGAYIALSDMGKYVAQVNILLVPKNEKIATYIDKVSGNLVAIFEDSSGGSEVFTIKTSKENTLINIRVEDYSKKEAIAVSQKTSQEIIKIASKYYNVKTDLDVRIVNTKTEKGEQNMLLVILLSIVLGIVLSFIAQLMVSLVEDAMVSFAKKRKNTSDISKGIEGMLSRNKSKIEELSYFPKRKIVTESKIETVKSLLREDDQSEEEVSANFKKAASPQNLPIEFPDNGTEEYAELKSDIPSNLPFEIMDKPMEENIDDSARNTISAGEEPTNEEYRKRLNELLGNKYF